MQRRITASILACGWRLDSLNSVLLKAADVCLDPDYRLFTIPVFTSRLLITSDRRQPRFNTITVLAIKFFILIFHCCGKSFISPSARQDVFGNRSTGRFLLVHSLHAAAPRLVSLHVCSLLPHSRTGADVCGLPNSVHVYSTLLHQSQLLWAA